MGVPDRLCDRLILARSREWSGLCRLMGLQCVRAAGRHRRYIVGPPHG
jgi:hypothetical protein